MSEEREPKMWYMNFKEEDFNDVRHGDVIVYKARIPLLYYLVVESVDIPNRKIFGEIASTVSVNEVPLENIVE